MTFQSMIYDWHHRKKGYQFLHLLRYKRKSKYGEYFFDTSGIFLKYIPLKMGIYETTFPMLSVDDYKAGDWERVEEYTEKSIIINNVIKIEKLEGDSFKLTTKEKFNG